ncbi:hypothetical protein C7271_01435 [filamentous cyanobacterium CCP5]|nr:hypothetical protein C7271_01435 [filamentous cyanobacterium CCP5]
MTNKDPSLKQLWQQALPTEKVFQPEDCGHLPELAQRYLHHAIAPGTRLASAVRLRMHGDIKLKGWQPFRAEEVISWGQGMIWQATTWVKGIPLSGWDRLVNGEGGMRWKLLGLLPVVQEEGPNVTRSAIGRMLGECIWLPSVLYQQAQWTTVDDMHVQAALSYSGETIQLNFILNPTGRVDQFRFQRWGNPKGAEHSYVTFGGYVDGEGIFGGYTIPTQIRGGWYFGSKRFEPEGDFFHATIDGAMYR